MTPTRWMFEHIALSNKESEIAKAVVDILWRTAKEALGLGFVPPIEDKETGVLEEAGYDHINLFAIINPEMFADVIRKMQALAKQKGDVEVQNKDGDKESNMTYKEMADDFDSLAPIFDEVFPDDATIAAKAFEDQQNEAVKAGVLKVEDANTQKVDTTNTPKRKVSIKLE